MSLLKKTLKAITPHGLVELRRKLTAKTKQSTGREEEHAARRERIARVLSQAPSGAKFKGYDYEQVAQFLIRRGLPEFHVREGSVPRPSLDFLAEEVLLKIPSNCPPKALHIGNFVGVSLAYIAATLAERNPAAIVVSVDPNLCHRSVSNPQAHVAALLAACGLQRNAIILAGYSGAKSLSNDGVVFAGYEPDREFVNEDACEMTLVNLGKLSTKAFDFVMMDGNHEAEYLIEEIKQTLPLLKEGAYVVLDDVDEAWTEIRDVFQNIRSLGLTAVSSDGRIGVARYTTAS